MLVNTHTHKNIHTYSCLRINAWSSDSRNTPKELKVGSQIAIFTPVPILALFTVAKKQVPSKCPPTNKGVSAMCWAHTVPHN